MVHQTMKTITFIICIIFLFINCNEKKEEKKSNSIELVSEDTYTVHRKDSNIDAINFKVNKDTLKANFNNNSSRTLEDYKNNISQAKKVLDTQNKLDDLAVESLIPTNLEEFNFFYELTYSTDEDWNLFEEINTLIIRNSQFDVGDCIEKYLNLAEFVDGEYAESFYNDIFFIAEKNTYKFCDVYNNLSAISKDNLEDIHNKFCEVKER